MAHPTLPVLSHPNFPQVFAEAMDQRVTRSAPPVQLSLSICCYEEPESRWGACDGGYPCTETATVTDISTDMDYCFAHWKQVSRG